MPITVWIMNSPPGPLRRGSVIANRLWESKYELQKSAFDPRDGIHPASPVPRCGSGSGKVCLKRHELGKEKGEPGAEQSGNQQEDQDDRHLQRKPFVRSVMVYAHGYLPFMKHKNRKKKKQILTILQAVVMTSDRYAGYSSTVAKRLQEQEGCSSGSTYPALRPYWSDQHKIRASLTREAPQ